MIARRLDSLYEMGRRSGAGLKVKNRQRQELVIGGWVEGEGRRRGLPGALLLGYYDGDRFRLRRQDGHGLHARHAGQAGGADAASSGRPRRSTPAGRRASRGSARTRTRVRRCERCPTVGRSPTSPQVRRTKAPGTMRSGCRERRWRRISRAGIRSPGDDRVDDHRLPARLAAHVDGDLAHVGAGPSAQAGRWRRRRPPSRAGRWLDHPCLRVAVHDQDRRPQVRRQSGLRRSEPSAGRSAKAGWSRRPTRVH